MFRLGTKQISEVSHSEVSFKKISVFFMHRRSEIVLFGSYFNPALGFIFILLFLRLTFLKVINFQM